MPPRLTRSKSSKSSKGSKALEDEPTSQVSTSKTLQTTDDLHRVCILPNGVSNAAEIVYLPHPSTSAPSAFLFSPENGSIYELTKVAASRKAARSWLIARDQAEGEHAAKGLTTLQNGFVIEDADMLVATPFDPLFLLSCLLTAGKTNDKSSFRLADDYTEILSEQSKTLARLLRNDLCSAKLLKRLEAISDVQDIGDDKVYKPNKVAFARILVKKACRMIAQDVWPRSMDENLVKKELEVPIVQKQQDVEKDKNEESTAEFNAQTTEQSEPPQEQKQQVQIESAVLDRMRIRKALDYLLSAYVPTALRADLESIFQTDEIMSITDLLDPTILNSHLDKVKQAKTEAVALRSLSDNISRKRGMDDEELNDARAEKKRKKEEEELKKKNESRALRNLKKADTSGMKKMSSFFTKLPAKKEQPA